MSVPKLRIAALNKRFRTKDGSVEVLRDISLDLAENEFVSLVVTSGCGKST